MEMSTDTRVSYVIVKEADSDEQLASADQMDVPAAEFTALPAQRAGITVDTATEENDILRNESTEEEKERRAGSPRGVKRRVSTNTDLVSQQNSEDKLEVNCDKDKPRVERIEDIQGNGDESPCRMKRRLSTSTVEAAHQNAEDENSYKSSEQKEKPTDESQDDSKKSELVGSKPQISATVIEISDDSSDSSICAVDSYQATAAEVKRIRGADYSSSSDYSSDDSSSCEDDSVVLRQERASCSLVSQRRAALNPRADRTDEPELSPCFKAPDLEQQFLTHWRDKEDFSAENISLKCEPFRVCLLHNLLRNPEIINNIVDDMNTLDWARKKMDLYEFHQTTDLANLSWQRSIRGIYQLFRQQLMPWISSVTGLKLSHMSASCSLYGPGDHLLVHDDLLGDRKVAFILYLAPWSIERAPRRTHNGSDDAAKKPSDDEQDMKGGWCASMGGALELLATDGARQPTEVVRSVLPRNNTLAFFQVTPESFHQVAEVTSLEFPRLSINGWFHGPDEAGETAEEPQRAPPDPVKPHTDIVLMGSWLSPTYMMPRTRLQIQQQMEKASEIGLHDFLVPEKYEAVLEALGSEEAEWVPAGPAHQRRYDALQLERLDSLERTHPLRELVKLFTSNHLYKFLADCTELTLRSHFHFEVQRWRPGCFTVLPPKELYGQNQLDLVLYIGFPTYTINGGVTTYVAPEDSNSAPLISLEPRSNTLNLVYSDATTTCFTKYVSKLTMKPDDHFYILTCSYIE